MSYLHHWLWTLKNDFHKTSVTLRVRIHDCRGPHKGDWIQDMTDGTWMLVTDNQAQRARRTLCPSRRSGCTCGGPFGEHGPQEVNP